MINAQDPSARRELLRRQHAELSRQIAAIQASLELIECALECDHDDFTQCTHFRAVVADRIGLGWPRHVRV